MKQLVFLFLVILPFFTKAQNWEPLGKGVSWEVRRLFFDVEDSTLYAGGSFTYADTIIVNGIGKWKDNKWDSLGNGIGFNTQYTTHGRVMSMTKFQGSLYAAGTFAQIGGKAANNIARWDGNEWYPADTSAFDTQQGGILRIKEINNNLYVAGMYETIGNVYSPGIAIFDGINWSSFPQILDTSPYGPEIADFIIYKDELHVAGNFSATAGPFMKDIARWDGNQWKALDKGFSGGGTHVNSLAVYKGDLYMGGYFYKSFGDPGNCIARWDGNEWKETGLGFDYQVVELMVHGGYLWAVGQFLNAEGLPSNNIARFDGESWCNIEGDITNSITAIAASHDGIYIGGGFNIIEGDTMNGITKWTGNEVDSCSAPVGVIEAGEKRMGINIFPNPAYNNIYLQLNYPGLSTLKLFDFSATLLFAEEISNKANHQIDISSLPAGLYIVVVENEEGIFREKLVCTKDNK